MRDNELGAFSALLDGVWALKGQSLPSAAKAMWFRALAPYPLEAVRSALDAHLGDADRGRFLPMPADVLAQLSGFDGRPGAEEAWATAVRAQDEADTVVWTTECAEAFGIARPVLEAGDEVGARMAFREAYERLVEEARRARRPAAWSASLGDDVRRRDSAIGDAIKRGLLPRSELPSLPAPRGPVALLELPPGDAAREEAIQALLKLREWLTAAPEVSESPDAAAKRETQRRARESMLEVSKRMGPETLQ
jgi:hypothetical protein